METMTETTQAKQARNQLHAKYVVIEDDVRQFHMSYDHLVICHGCGKIHAERCIFMSSPLAIAFKFADGSSVSIPAHGCGECGGEAVKTAYQNGMSRASYDRAATEMGANLRPAPQPCKLCTTLENPVHLNTEGAHSLCAALAKIGKPTPPREQRYF